MFCSDLPGISKPLFCPKLLSQKSKTGKMWQINDVNRASLLNCSEHFLRNWLFAFQLSLLLSDILNFLYPLEFACCILKPKVRVGVPTNVRCGVWHLHPVNIVVSLYHMVETMLPLHRHQRFSDITQDCSNHLLPPLFL